VRILKLQTPSFREDSRLERRFHIWKPTKRGAQHCSAFTLIELVISASLMAMILTAAYMCLNAAIAGQKLIEPRAEVLQNARVVMAMLSADLRSACPLSKDYEFLGMQRMLGDVQADNLDFATHNYSPRRANEGDFCEVSYFVQKEGETGRVSLWRRRNPTIAPDPLSGGNREQLARGLRGVSFEYFDGFDWYDTWGEIQDRKKQKKDTTELPPNLSGMPEAVRVTLWFDPNPKPPKEGASAETPSEPPLVFQTVVRLNLSAASQSGLSAGGDTGAKSTGDKTAQPQEGNQ
jgi:prepilin-type N-terminal cleavage/methylation domain-containing protein